MSIFFSGLWVSSNPPTGFASHSNSHSCNWIFSISFLLIGANGLLQMIDLYWTVIPVMLVHYFATHPLAQSNAWRSRLVLLLTWVWSLRLTHSYFRRERWQWGAREDWRFNDLRRQYGKNWWWMSFFAVYLSQQVIIFAVLYGFDNCSCLEIKPDFPFDQSRTQQQTKKLERMRTPRIRVVRLYTAQQTDK